MTSLTTIVKHFMTTGEQVSRALNDALKAGHIHIDEVAQVCGVSERQAYRYSESEVSLKANQYIALALIEDSRGGNNLISLIVPNSKVLVKTLVGAVDGRIEQEAIELVERLGKTTESYSKMDFDNAIGYSDLMIESAKKINVEAREAKKRKKGNSR